MAEPEKTKLEVRNDGVFVDGEPIQSPGSENQEQHNWIYGGIGGAGFATILCVGLFGVFLEDRIPAGILLTLVGAAGLIAMAFLIKGHRLGALHAATAALIATWVFFGYDIYDRRIGGIPNVSPPSAQHNPLDFQVCYEQPCPTPEESARRRAFADELRAIGSYAPDGPRIVKFVAEEAGAPFARLLINLCVTGGSLPIMRDKASGSSLWAPTEHRLEDGVTIRAPTNSATAEAFRVALAGYGVKAKRLGPLPDMGDNVVIEVGRVANGNSN